MVAFSLSFQWRAKDFLSLAVGLREGGFDAAMAGQVLAARRRPRGHLLPQSLAVHAGLDDCLRQRVLRVQRIAVHPQRRREGVATRLLDAGAQGSAFVNEYFGVNYIDKSVRHLISDQTAPLVVTIENNGVIASVDRWIAYGGCPGDNTFDGVVPTGTGQRLAVVGRIVALRTQIVDPV